MMKVCQHNNKNNNNNVILKTAFAMLARGQKNYLNLKKVLAPKRCCPVGSRSNLEFLFVLEINEA